MLLDSFRFRGLLDRAIRSGTERIEWEQKTNEGDCGPGVGVLGALDTMRMSAENGGRRGRIPLGRVWGSSGMVRRGGDVWLLADCIVMIMNRYV
jgi:hypothetical protein